MSKDRIKYLIIGNGIAGTTAAEEIRKIDGHNPILMISDEDYLTYYRVKLSHFINKKYSLTELLIHDEDWYKEKNIQTKLGKRIKSIDIRNCSVQLEDGEKIDYEKLLVANGGSASIPEVMGAEKKGIYALRNLEDLEKVQEYLLNCKEVAVIGGGLLGLEAAWALKELGIRVNVVEFFPYLLPKQLDSELAKHVKEQLEQRGLYIYLGAAAEEIVGEDRVEGIVLQEGQVIPVDMVLFSTGMKSNRVIVEGTNIQTNKGIQVNAFMETSQENIYAAGDVAEFEGVVMGLWSTAMDQGKIAGRNMAGIQERYKPLKPATYLSIGGFSLFSVGEIDGEQFSLSYQEETVFHKLFIKDGKLIGGVLTGDIKKMAKLKKAVNDGLDVSSMLQEGLSLQEVLEKL